MTSTRPAHDRHAAMSDLPPRSLFDVSCGIPRTTPTRALCLPTHQSRNSLWLDQPCPAITTPTTSTITTPAMIHPNQLRHHRPLQCSPHGHNLVSIDVSLSSSSSPLLLLLLLPPRHRVPNKPLRRPVSLSISIPDLAQHYPSILFRHREHPLCNPRLLPPSQQ